MSFRFLHSADWQLGARFTQFGEAAPRLRAARLRALRQALELAQERRADAFIVAGDLFEDNQVDDALVRETVALFAEFAPLPIVLLPGNHDPFSGPESVWERPAFRPPPANVRVLHRAEAIPLSPPPASPGTLDSSASPGNTFAPITPAAWLLAAPLTQKKSATDPSLKLAELARELDEKGPGGILKIGVTHGSPAIAGKHQPDDFPIALNAASRAGLDYLAVGHWHNWLDADEGRIVMPGTPEPDDFDHTRGKVAWVELAAPGALPRVEPLDCHVLTWTKWPFDFLDSATSKATIDSALKSLRASGTGLNTGEEAVRATPQTTVTRVVLTGAATPGQNSETTAWLEKELADFCVAQVIDETTLTLSEAALQDLRTRHPILAQALRDLERLEFFFAGKTAPPAAISIEPTSREPKIEADSNTNDNHGTDALSFAEAQKLLGDLKFNPQDLPPEFFPFAQRLLLQTAQEIS